MRCVLVCLVVLQLLVSTISSSCHRKCGGIEIPFPFGVGKGCYLDHWYEVQCKKNPSSGKFYPILPKIQKEVVQINLPRSFESFNEPNIPSGSLVIKTKISSIGCPGQGKNNNLMNSKEVVLNFSGSPFVISGGINTLMGFGCNMQTSLTHINNILVACNSTCEFQLVDERDRICSGYKCCSATIAEDSIDATGVKIEEFNQTSTTGGGEECGVAFLTNEFNQTLSPWENITNPQWFHARQYATIQLNWKIVTTNISFEESLRCSHNPFYQDPADSNPCYCEWVHDNTLLQTRCACNAGYKGNPYLLEDCKDVDECQGDIHDKYCNRGETCLNIPGSYRCVPINKTKPYLLYIGISIGLGVLIVGVAIWLYKVIKKHRKRKRQKHFFKRNGGLLLQQELSSSDGCVEKTRIFTSKELDKATEAFSSKRVLGQGGQGTVYKGVLVDGTTVAVKKSKVMDEDKIEEFINEVVILSQINHRNIVKILGCCLETEVPILVYEFIPNGNLYEHLHTELELEDRMVTTWESRFRIAIDIAGALSYLHSSISTPIYHRDVKSSNIMLDDKGRAKVGDFGTSRTVTVDHTHLTTVVTGTVGYVDPEYFQTSQFTDKSDTYSFGVVLAELITGKKALSLQGPQEDRALASSFIHAMEQDGLFDIIDPRIKDECKLEQVMKIAKIAKASLNLEGRKRPSMREISMELERVFSSQSELYNIGNDEEDEITEVDTWRESLSIDVPAITSSTSQHDISTMWSSDAEPLYPRKTW